MDEKLITLLKKITEAIQEYEKTLGNFVYVEVNAEKNCMSTGDYHYVGTGFNKGKYKD